MDNIVLAVVNHWNVVRVPFFLFLIIRRSPVCNELTSIMLCSMSPLAGSIEVLLYMSIFSCISLDPSCHFVFKGKSCV